VKLLQEDNGNTSMTRILSLIIVIAGLGIGIAAILTGTLTSEAVTLCLGLVTIGFTGKVVSKGLEK
jgi:hypothetical protein